MALHQNLKRHFAERSGFITFPVKNAHHGVLSGTVPDSHPGVASRETIEAIRTEIEQFTPIDSVTALTLFIAEAETAQSWSDQIAASFPQDATPVLTCVAQPACEPNRIGFEGYVIASKNVSFNRDRSNRIVTVRHDGLTWLYGAQVVSPVPSDVYRSSLEMFHQAQDALVRADSHFNQVIRTWLYQGDIVGREGRKIRYHELNRARSDFFEHDTHTMAPYPASTGIGQAGADITMNYLALTADRADSFHNMALENPLQISAFDYEEKYGSKSPKFSRAIVTLLDRQAIVWVSGTASITDSKTRHHDNVMAQTHQTLKNIRALISAENLARHGIDHFGAGLDDLVSVRIYIKNRSDYPAVRSLCETQLGRTPAIYVLADICRKDLLVEIEAIGYCK